MHPMRLYVPLLSAVFLATAGLAALPDAQPEGVTSLLGRPLAPPVLASDNEAQVLVAVTVTTSNVGAPEQEPRAWRMRLTVQKVGDDAKVSNVEFVP